MDKQKDSFCVQVSNAYLCPRRKVMETEKKTEIGREGEREARAYLEKREYNILHTNWRWHHYELDIVAEKEGELVVVEVKTRDYDSLLSPEEAVDRKKIRRIVAAADAYVRHYNLDLPVRFDIVTVIRQEGRMTLDHIEDAFMAPCN